MIAHNVGKDLPIQPNLQDICAFILEINRMNAHNVGKDSLNQANLHVTRKHTLDLWLAQLVHQTSRRPTAFGQNVPQLCSKKFFSR